MHRFFWDRRTPPCIVPTDTMSRQRRQDVALAVNYPQILPSQWKLFRNGVAITRDKFSLDFHKACLTDRGIKCKIHGPFQSDNRTNAELKVNVTFKWQMFPVNYSKTYSCVTFQITSHSTMKRNIKFSSILRVSWIFIHRSDDFVSQLECIEVFRCYSDTFLRPTPTINVAVLSSIISALFFLIDDSQTF